MTNERKVQLITLRRQNSVALSLLARTTGFGGPTWSAERTFRGLGSAGV